MKIVPFCKCRKCGGRMRLGWFQPIIVCDVYGMSHECRTINGWLRGLWLYVKDFAPSGEWLL